MIGYRYDDGGRAAAGYRGKTGDCVVRAIAICAREDYRSVYATMAEHMKRNGYAASGNAYATRERNRKAPRRRGQLTARRVQDRVLEAYGFRRVRLPSGERPTFTEAHHRYGDCIVGTTKHVAVVVDGTLRDVFDGRTYEWDFEMRERKAQSIWVRVSKKRRDDMRLSAQAKGGYYPTPERVVDLIADLIHTPSGYYHRARETVRILDPCCGAGDALQRLAELLDRPNSMAIETYGVELHRDRAEEAEKVLHRALAADLFQTSIANGAFGLLLLNPPYDWDSEDKRVEHAFLTHTTRYLAESGLLVFIVPRQRLSYSARYLSTHYGRLQCWAFPDPEREVFDQVVVFGYRKTDPVPDAHAEGMVMEWSVGQPEPLRSRRDPYSYGEYTPATSPSGDILFTTRSVDPVAAATEARRSGLWTNTDITDSLWPAGDARTRPLMPLRRGHIAMLVAAGFLNNLVLEGDGRRILVKGRTSKEMELVEDSPEKEVHREKLKTTVVALDLDDGGIEDIAA